MKLSLLSFLVFSTIMQGASLTIPDLTVLGTDAADGLGFDAGGPTFTVVGNFLGTDTLSLTVTGTVDLASGLFTSNAAGIITAPATTNTGAHPGQTSPNGDNSALNYGALLIGNSTLGFFQVFPSSATYGLGNPTPPTTLVLNDESLSAIGFTSGLTNGTVLEFRVSDINSGDNSGQFSVTQTPEPATLALVGLGLVAMTAVRRRLAGIPH